MKKILIRNTLLILTALLFLAPPSWAKSNGFCYVVSYSFANKKAYFSPIFVQKVNSKSYSDEEFVTDVELIQKIESQFKSFISSLVNLDPSKYTISARGAYKSNPIAIAKYKDEKHLYETKGYSVVILKDFKFVD